MKVWIEGEVIEQQASIHFHRHPWGNHFLTPSNPNSTSVPSPVTAPPGIVGACNRSNSPDLEQRSTR
jgi:hypothetical protein